MAPIDAAPAPVRKPWPRRWSGEYVETGAADQHEDEGRGEGDDGGEQPAEDAGGGVADDGDRLDDGSGRDLAEGDGVEELPADHPVVGVRRRRAASAGR